jgi:alkylhydroperoxidase family enzyme
VEAVLEDYATAPISKQERALFAFITKVNGDSTSIRQADIDVAREAGWSDEALYDAITVCALFRFYNTWIDATGVGDLPAPAYRMSGQRLATQGYVVNGPSATPAP